MAPHAFGATTAQSAKWSRPRHVDWRPRRVRHDLAVARQNEEYRLPPIRWNRDSGGEMDGSKFSRTRSGGRILLAQQAFREGNQVHFLSVWLPGDTTIGQHATDHAAQ